MNVLQVTNSMSATVSSGGVEVVVRNIHQALKMAKLESRVCAMSTKSDIPIEMVLPDYCITNTLQLIPSKTWSRMSLAAVKNLRRSLKLCDIVHIHLCKDFYTVFCLAICRIQRKPHVIQTHGMIAPKKTVIGRISNFLIKLLVSNGQLLCLTELERDQLQNLGFKGSKLIVPNPILVEEFEPYTSAHRRFDIMFMSRFHKRKRPEVVVEAVGILKKNGRNTRTMMCGPDDGNLLDTIALAKSHGLEELIEFPGSISRDKISKVFKSARVFVLPSYGEIYPMAALESASSSTPMILGSDCPLAMELFESGAALIADTPEELAIQIEKILSDNLLAGNLVQNAYQWIKNNCSYEIYSSLLIPLYESIINE